MNQPDRAAPGSQHNSSTLRQIVSNLPGWRTATLGRALRRITSGPAEEAGERQRFQEVLVALEGCRAAGLGLELRFEPGRLSLRLWNPASHEVDEEMAQLAQAITRAGLSTRQIEERGHDS